MNNCLKKSLLGLGIALISATSLLTGCNTIQGTAYGAKKDFQTVTGSHKSKKHHKGTHHKTKAPHHKKAPKNTAKKSAEKMNTQPTPAQNPGGNQ